ncbi:MAG: hypothetical protein ACJAV6_000648 [Candidatus Paceibacteria bacterium]|jgi:hypothetical protein
MIELKTTIDSSSNNLLSYNIHFDLDTLKINFTDSDKRNYIYDSERDEVFFLEKISTRPSITLINQLDFKSLLKKSNKDNLRETSRKKVQHFFTNYFDPLFFLSVYKKRTPYRFHLVRKNFTCKLSHRSYDRYSIVIKCELKNMREFQEHIFRYYGYPFFEKTTYITLFTGANNYEETGWEQGIDFSGSKDLQEHCIFTSSSIEEIFNVYNI